MKNVNLTVNLIIVILIGISCTKIPEPCWKYNSNVTHHQGDTVTFRNCSIDGSSYLWSFGDSSSSTEANPSHVFRYPGQFSVILLVSSENGKKTTGIGQMVNISLKPPKKITINKIVLSSFSTSFYKPDIYMVLTDYSGNILNQSEIYDDCEPENQYTFTKGFPIEFPGPGEGFGVLRIEIKNAKGPIEESFIGLHYTDLLNLFEVSLKQNSGNYATLENGSCRVKVYFNYEY